jgi:NAD+ synthase
MQIKKVINLITKWLTEYSIANGHKNFVIGISGGIDSALTSTLCAMTGSKTFLVSMPIHQKKAELRNAKKHMEWLCKKYSNVEMIEIELTNVLDEYIRTIPIRFRSELGFANSRARLRMTTLYQIATKKNGIVVGTGNKIEDFGIGFFTKYGDGGVDISPIADLTKSEVRALAKFCKVDKDIIQAAPTDGLWNDGRTDETQIGATYEELEWAMDFNTDTKMNQKEQKIIDIYNNLNTKNKHKMTPIPICKIPKTLRD